jgi:sulfofructose kinase
MTTPPLKVDVLCIGHACYDLIFSVKSHPQSDEKIFADNLLQCGGGPAANAAIAVSRLGLTAAFAGYLGQDLYGEMHYQEFNNENINTHLLTRGSSPTPLSTVLVKPDGKRALVNYKGSTTPLSTKAIDFSSINPKVILFDGHEPSISLNMLERAQHYKIPTVLDAGSMHTGTEKLWNKVDYLVASEKFALQFANNVHSALNKLAKEAPTVVISLGDKGLIWKKNNRTGSLTAFPIKAIDTTGAGDAFHGAFSAGLATGLDWSELLLYSSAAGALCCTKIGARQGLPDKIQISKLLNNMAFRHNSLLLT